MNNYGLYIHIPFCGYICNYCDFVKMIPKNQEIVDKYLNRLVQEINLYQKYFNKITTIYIGGGTPSILSCQQLDYLLSRIFEINAIEKTIEINPESYTLEKGLVLKKYGINRVSIGVQSFKQETINYIGRNHNLDDVIYAINSLKSIGINNISIDLIYAIPGQSIDDIKNDLNFAISLDVKHISYYSLILEDKTFFYHQFLKGKFKPVDNEIEASMFELIIKSLKDNGFEHYEISNFAKKGYESKHNMLYWNHNNYIGVGLGAHGFVDNLRTYNNVSLNKYFNEFQKSNRIIDMQENLADELIFGLRLLKGVNISYIENKYEIDLMTKFPQLEFKIKQNLVEIKEGYLKLTEKGIFFGNLVFEVFI